MKKHSHYEILQIDQNSSTKQIKRAFQCQIKKYHPDKQFKNSMVLSKQENENQKTSTKEQSMRIIEAYHILSDPLKRAEYDKVLNYESRRSQIQNCRYKEVFNLNGKKAEQNCAERLQKEQKKEKKQLSTSNNDSVQEQSEGQQEGQTILYCQQCLSQINISQILENFYNQNSSQLTKPFNNEQREYQIQCSCCGICMNVVI